MRTRILLVSPARNYFMNNEMYPSGALLLLGTTLKNQGHAVRVIHSVADEVNPEKFQNILREFRPDIVGFTVSTYQTKATKALSLMTKNFNNRIVTVAGGAHPSALKGEFLATFPSVDIVVYGDGERTMLNIASGVAPVRIRGVCYRENNRVIVNDANPILTTDDLDALPLPDVNLINFKKYSGLFPVGKRPSMFIMSSRGCPYLCTFCSKSICGNTLRLRSPESVVAEVDLLYRDWGVREIHFGDDTFNANRQWTDRLLNLIIKGGHHKRLLFRVALRVNEKILDLDLLKHLKAANVWFIYYGVENGNQDMLNHMRKGITVAEVKRAFRLTHSIGLKTEAFFIIGMPGETERTIQDSHRLYREIKPYWGGFSRAMPFPGTVFTQEVKEAGHLLCEDYDKFSPSLMAVRTEDLTADELDMWTIRMNRLADVGKMKQLKQVAYVLKDRAFRR